MTVRSLAALRSSELVLSANQVEILYQGRLFLMVIVETLSLINTVEEVILYPQYLIQWQDDGGEPFSTLWTEHVSLRIPVSGLLHRTLLPIISTYGSLLLWR